MTLRWDDRCKVTATAPGTGAIPAASPAAAGGFIQISAITNIANSDIVPYTITDGATLFENGYGTWNSVTGLTRTTVKTNSSRNTSAINFTGAVTVFCGAIAASLPLLDASGNLSLPGALSYGGVTLTAAVTGTGKMVLDTAPTISGNLTVTGNIVLSGSFPTIGPGSNDRVQFDNSGHNFQPISDNTLNLGQGGSRWIAVYAVNGAIQTSDERFKDWSGAQTDYRQAIQNLWVGDVVMYDDMERTKNPRHMLAIRAQQAFAALGGVGIVKPENDEGIWGEKSAEFAHLALWGVKDLYALLAEQAAKIETLESRLAALEAKG